MVTDPPGDLRFSEDHRKVLEAAVERLLPSDDGPGARETGVAAYVERALNRRWYRHLFSLFEEGMDFLQTLSSEIEDGNFLDLEPARQDEVLRQAQVYPNTDARRFFAHLLEISLEGFLGDPRHGGNRDGLGWSYLGHEPGSSDDPCHEDEIQDEIPPEGEP